MKVLQVLPELQYESSGLSHFVPGLCCGLQSAEVSVSLHVFAPLPSKSFPFSVHAYPKHDFPSFLRGRSPEMLNNLTKECKTAEVIHNNGLWMMPNVYPGWAIHGTNCKLVTSPHGTLADWSLRRSYWIKKAFGILFQNRVLRHTHMFHATSNKEYEEIRAAGYDQPVAIIPIGMDIPEGIDDVKAKWLSSSRRRIVFFGRLHKVKAVENLIIAWSRLCKLSKEDPDLARSIADWELSIAGPDGGMREELERIARSDAVPKVSINGELNGYEKYVFLASSDICVLPSHTENFGVTVAESLACRTPVIASQGTPWQGLVKEKAGMWIPFGVDPLVDALRHVICLSDEERRRMGTNGRNWMVRDFSWHGIGTKMKMAYEWLLGKSERPDWVIVD